MLVVDLRDELGQRRKDSIAQQFLLVLWLRYLNNGVNMVGHGLMYSSNYRDI